MSSLMRNYNLRFIIGGCFLTIIGVITLITLWLGIDIPYILRHSQGVRAYNANNLTVTIFAYVIITVGIIGLVIGFIRKSKSKVKPEN